VEASLVGTSSTFGVPTANLVLYPDWHDVEVGSNLFGDIASDLGPSPSASRCARTGQIIEPTEGLKSKRGFAQGEATGFGQRAPMTLRPPLSLWTRGPRRLGP
jgi:hypothetical protein